MARAVSHPASDTSPRELSSLLRNIALVRVIQGGAEFEFRILGDAIMQSQTGLQARHDNQRSRRDVPGYGALFRVLYQLICDARAIHRPIAAFTSAPPISALSFTNPCCLPLGADDGVVDHILIVGVYAMDARQGAVLNGPICAGSDFRLISAPKDNWRKHSMALDLETRKHLIETVRRFVTEKCVPIEAKVSEEDRVPDEIIAEMKTLGLFGLSIPEEFGGLGLNMEEEVLIAFELGQTSPAFRSVIGTNVGIGSQGVVMFGSDEQKNEWLPKLASGEIVASFALTEPNAGSDAASVRTTAIRDGDHYVVNGTKRFITNAKRAGMFTLMARSDPCEERAPPAFPPSSCPRATPGISIGKSEKKMGQQGAHIHDVIFENARVPARLRLGAEGEGFKVAMQVLDRGRLHISGVCVGVAERLIRECVNYAREREQFGQRLGDFQLIQAMLADSKTEAYAARCMVLDAARAPRCGRERHAGMRGRQIFRLRNGGPRCRPRGADFRRRRLCRRLRHRAFLSRRAHLPHLRRHQPDPAVGHRPQSAARRLMAEGTRKLSRLLTEIRACRVCAPYPAAWCHGPSSARSMTAKLCIIAQAPGFVCMKRDCRSTIHLATDCANGSASTAIRFTMKSALPSSVWASAFLGYNAQGADLPPRKECAPLWHPSPVRNAAGISHLRLLIGTYALNRYLGDRRQREHDRNRQGLARIHAALYSLAASFLAQQCVAEEQSMVWRRIVALSAQACAACVVGLIAACAPALAPHGPENVPPSIASDDFVTRDGLHLPLRHWDAKEPKAIIVALHGMSDYSNGFAIPAPYLAEPWHKRSGL